MKVGGPFFLVFLSQLLAFFVFVNNLGHSIKKKSLLFGLIVATINNAKHLHASECMQAIEGLFDVLHAAHRVLGRKN